MRYKICRQLGRKIARLRKKQKFSQEELAFKAGLYIRTLGTIERGESNPSVYTVFKISKALKTAISEFFRF